MVCGEFIVSNQLGFQAFFREFCGTAVGKCDIDQGGGTGLSSN
jgi:hypothetical protein